MTDANEYYLRKHDHGIITAEEYREERDVKINELYELLKYSPAAVTEAAREATYGNCISFQLIQIAYVNKNMEELGKLVYDLIDKELKLEAERIVD